MKVLRRGFTLIELLTVIAITAVLLTLIVAPIFQSFNLLRAGQGFSEAQERSRVLLDRISREISNSAGVRDNSGLYGEIDVPVPTGAGSPSALAYVPLSYAKLDIVKPAEGIPQVDASGNPIFTDPITGKVDPTLTAPKGQVVLPVAPGATIVRYFIGLRDPFLGATTPNGPGVYNNPYDGLLMLRNGGRDNLFVLYRAEVQPFLPAAGGGYTPNTNYFATDANGNIVFDDPKFFVPDGTAAKETRIQNWLKHAVVQTEVSRYDMVLPVYNKSTRAVAYDVDSSNNLIPRLIPLVQFRPTRISSEPATAQRSIRLGEEADNSLALGSDVITTTYGAWTSAYIKTWPRDIATNTAYNGEELDGYYGARSDGTTGFSIYENSLANGTETLQAEMFDVSAYSNGINGASPSYPFSAAATAAETRSNWTQKIPLSSFVPYFVDTSSGKVITSFGINEVGLKPLKATAADPTATRPNLPIVQGGTYATPGASPGTGAVWGGSGYTINDAFNLAWNTYPYLRPNIQRYVDLRVTPNEDGTYGPLFPSVSTNTSGANVVLSNNGNGFPRAAIVPGSEQVFGPDENAGPNFGNEVRYTRTTREPGPNQYRINYVEQAEPSDLTVLGLKSTDLTGFNPSSYDPTNFVSATIDARYRAGYIELDSDPNTPLPSGTNIAPIRVSYRFQFNRALDAFAVDYDSRQVLSLALTIRNYPQTSVPNPQTVTLQTSATIRNFLR